MMSGDRSAIRNCDSKGLKALVLGGTGALGVSIFFAVYQYEERYGMAQPTIQAMKTVLDNLHWNINNVS